MQRGPDGHDPGEAREDEEAFGGAEQRRAGGEHEAAVADVADRGRHVVGIDRALAGDGVDEVGVGHVQHDRVAAAQFVDVAERRQERRAVPGDRGRAAEPGEARAGVGPRRVDAGTLLEFFGAGALDDDEVGTDARDVDAADSAAGGAWRRSWRAR